MEKIEIKKILNTHYERDNWKNLIRNVFKKSNFFTIPKKIDSTNDKIKSIYEIGYIDLYEGKKLSFFEIEVNKNINLGKNKVELRNFITKFIDQTTNHGVLVIFNNQSDDYRLTFCSKYFEITSSGEFILKETNPKRYTYLLGSNEVCTTPTERLDFLKSKENITLNDVTDAFNVEKISNEFFDKYKDLYLNLFDDLSDIIKNNSKIKKNFELNKISIEEFAKKLLGQIVFIYFIQKKGWLGIKKDREGNFGKWGTGPKDFLRRLYKKEYKNYNNFFNEILEPLFYTALNSELPENYFPYLECKIPFLNGGLFEPIKNYNWIESDLLLKNDLFEKILDIFDQYNFTVNESDPLEKEVAIDPEMLGKTFEKLLDIKDRKSSGTFYTPREIVEFMCQDSLSRHLSSNVSNISDSILQKLFNTETIDEISKLKEIKKNALDLDKNLKEIKVCDPSIGTGAFIVEMLNLIVKTRKKLDFFLDKNRSDYSLKLHTIQKTLYGVDIKDHAVDIAKLRLWLSLILDENNFEKINSLPNLDFKFMTGNSLYKNKQPSLLDHEIYKNIEILKDQYLTTNLHSKKKSLMKEIEGLYQSIGDNNKEFDFYKSFSEIFDNNLNGFDIVIGNPPYVRGDSSDEDQIKKENDLYESIYPEVFGGGRTDLYIYFIKKSEEICKKNGIISLIVSNKWMTSNYGKKVRIYLSRRKIKKIIDFGDLPIFEAVVCPNIIVYNNTAINNKEQSLEILDAGEVIKNKMDSLNEKINTISIKKHLSEISSIFDDNKQILKSLSNDGSSWSVNKNTSSDLFSNAKELLKFKFIDKNIPIRRGIVTGLNDVFVINQEVYDQFISEDKNCKKFLKSYLKGRGITPWVQKNILEYIIFADRNFQISKCPLPIRNYLLKYKDILSQRTTVPEQHPWYQLMQPQVGYLNDFENLSKIVWRDISNRSVATIVKKEVYLDATCFYIPINDLALCSWMHSEFFINFLRTISSSIRGNAIRWKKQWIEQVYYYPEVLKKDLINVYKIALNKPEEAKIKLDKIVNQYLR
jgi:hypothetical protein